VVIAPAANAPYGAGALEVLDARGIVAVPDFIANGGGVQLYVGVQQDTAPPVALAAIEATLREITARTLGVAHERAITPVAAALSEGRRYLERAAGASPGLLDQLVAS
jgi:glutamate dehydrogenase/leucine dehydrogenase